MGVVTTVIRPMTVEDLPEVVALENAEQPTPWSEQVFGDELEQASRVYVVTGDPIVGFGGMMIIGEEAHITNLLVSATHRRRGIGKSLLAALVEAAIAAGARHMTLEVRSSNLATRRLYASVGLAPVGVRPKYYGDDDALIMWAHDIDEPGFLDSLR